jgi:hypothetical protein
VTLSDPVRVGAGCGADEQLLVHHRAAVDSPQRRPHRHLVGAQHRLTESVLEFADRVKRRQVRAAEEHRVGPVIVGGRGETGQRRGGDPVDIAA